ncbi:MAG: hypothetical protein OEV61_00890 [Chloroflexota bacterium]|jgi:hypothetical protein|nr:hypothetical protein [Chloroflexota bacterium]
MTDASRTSFDLETAPIRPPDRRRRPDPALVGALVVAVAVLVAIIKPWDAGPVASERSPRPSVAVASPGPTVPSRDPSSPRVANAILEALEVHHAWGIRVLTQGSGTLDFVERWHSAEPTDEAQVAPLVVSLVPSIAAIGITSPSGTTPLDVRAWARGHDGQWHRLDVRRFASDRPAADLLFAPPVVDGATLPVWPSGRYRFDLLMGGYVARMDLSIGADASIADAPVSSFGYAVDRGPVSWPADIQPGPYAVAGGVVIPLAGGGGDSLGVAEAWVAGDPVARAYLHNAVGLGVLLPSGASDAGGVIRRLAPESVFAGTTAIVGGRNDRTGERTPYVVFEGPGGGRFEPGVYAIDLAWSGLQGPRRATWHIELLPGPSPDVPLLLQAARRYAPFAGVDGLVVSGAGRPGADPATVPARLVPLAASIGCDVPVMLQTPAVLGLTHSPEDPPDRISATIARPLGRSRTVDLRIADGGAPGLTLIAPEDERLFVAGTYRFSVQRGEGAVEFTLCLGAPLDETPSSS